VEILQILWQLVVGIFQLVAALLAVALRWWVVIAWIAWWTFGVNWQKTRAVLKQGAWAPLVLLMLVIALVWSRVAPASLTSEFVNIPNFWWQLGAVALLVAFTFLCGVVQDALGWTPPEINLNPPADTGADHAHGHH